MDKKYWFIVVMFQGFKEARVENVASKIHPFEAIKEINASIDKNVEAVITFYKETSEEEYNLCPKFDTQGTIN